MKAAVFTRYGSSDAVRLEEVERPVPGSGEVLVKIHAASVSRADWEIISGGSFLTRLMTGLRRPKRTTPGADVAGRVEAVGENVTRFRAGDEVLGELFGTWGGFAEYVVTPDRALAAKSPSLTFEEAATLPTAAVLALHGLCGGRRLQRGEKVLINGAGGGVATFAIQIARSLGAEVTGVDSADKLDLMRSLGAEHVLDYRRDDFTRTGYQYDRILDVVGHGSLVDCLRALSPGGRYVLAGGRDPVILRVALLGSWLARPGRRRMGIIMFKPNLRDDLAYLQALLETGEVRPVIDRCYRLPEVGDAVRYVGEGRARGKVVIVP